VRRSSAENPGLVKKRRILLEQLKPSNILIDGDEEADDAADEEDGEEEDA
jgi:hypothetical protein